MLFICLVLPLLLIAGMFIRSIFLFDQMANSTGDEKMPTYSVEFFLMGIIGYIIFWIIPFLILNIFCIYFFNQKFSSQPTTFKKIFSDHTNIFTQSFIVFYIGAVLLFTAVGSETFYFFIIACTVFTAAFIIYFMGSFIILKFYLRLIDRKFKPLILYFSSVTLMSAVYALLIINLFLVPFEWL